MRSNPRVTGRTLRVVDFTPVALVLFFLFPVDVAGLWGGAVYAVPVLRHRFVFRGGLYVDLALATR